MAIGDLAVGAELAVIRRLEMNAALRVHLAGRTRDLMSVGVASQEDRGARKNTARVGGFGAKRSLNPAVSLGYATVGGARHAFHGVLTRNDRVFQRRTMSER